jgi:hypothetical protein
LRKDIGHRPRPAPKEEERINRRLGTGVDLTRDEAAYYGKLTTDGSAEAATEKRADGGGSWKA